MKSATLPGSMTPTPPDAVVQRLVAGHRDFLAFLERRVGNRAQAEDLLQDAFVRGLPRVGEVDPEAAVGWFYRVLEEGTAQAGDALVAESRGLHEWSMARLFEAIWGTNSAWDSALIAQITALPPLAEQLRRQLQEKLLAR